nr:STAS domain-containing protein [Lysinibacillus timonensis]
MFSYNLKEANEKITVFLDGDLDLEATEVFEETLMNEIQQTSGPVELDFHNIDFVDSSGIGLLITLINLLKDTNRQPTIIHLNEGVKRVFELLQLEEILGKDVVVL